MLGLQKRRDSGDAGYISGMGMGLSKGGRHAWVTKATVRTPLSPVYFSPCLTSPWPSNESVITPWEAEK